MAWRILKTYVSDADVTMVGCGFDSTSDPTDAEVAVEGIDEATVAAAGLGSTVVAAPTAAPQVGVGRVGVDYTARGRSQRCVICGFTFPLRTMIRRPASVGGGGGGWVDIDCYDQFIPIRGRTGQARSRRWTYFGQF